MAASYVGGLGGANGSDFSDTLIFTTTRAISAGDHVVMVVRATAAVASIVVGSLTLTLDYNGTNFAIYSKRATAGIASGATVTITFVSEISAGNKNAIGELLTNVVDTSYLRATAENEAFGSTVNVGNTDASPQIGDIAICMVRSSSDVVVASAINSVVFGDPTLTTSFRTGYRILPAAGSFGGNCFTLASGDDYASGVIVYVGGSSITLDSCLPDADVTTTGWTSTPLYSKVNDASDATVIQATAV